MIREIDWQRMSWYQRQIVLARAKTELSEANRLRSEQEAARRSRALPGVTGDLVRRWVTLLAEALEEGPREHPKTDREALVEDVEFLLASGADPLSIPARVDRPSIAAVEIALRRAGRNDLACVFWAARRREEAAA